MTRCGLLDRLRLALVGRPITIAPPLLVQHPELGEADWRAGGLPLRIGGWFLGQSTVGGITLGRTIFLADPARASPTLLLHELAHVRQFAEERTFPLRYCWESLRRGYARNRYETEADSFARAHVARATPAVPATRQHSSVRPD